MKKPCREERPGLKTELNKLSFLLFAILITQDIYSQIPINGFCKLNYSEVESGHNSIFPLNYNNDSYTDLFLFNKGSKNYSLLTGNFQEEKINERVISSSFELSRFTTCYDKDNNANNYGFTSRKNRLAGFANISSSGKINFTQTFKFDSYPENISANDIDGNGNSELLISGNGFNGISILHLDNNKLQESKLEKGKVFSESVFIDLSNDGKKDIAAFNLLNNSINFYYNYGSLRFGTVRSIVTGEIIHNLKSTNMNLDLYEDLIFTQQNMIRIMYGDAISSYQSVKTVNTKFLPDKFVTGDFNHDGKIDIAYINIKESTLSLIFAKSEFEFYDEIIYLKRNGIEDIVPYYSKFINGVALISSSGELITVTNLTSIGKNINLAAGVEPSALNYFDKDNNSMTDICYIDNYDRSLKLITRDNAGIPSVYYSVVLSDDHKEIKAIDISSRFKSFYCYSDGGRLIEIIKVDFKTQQSEKFSLYSPGNIMDFKIKQIDSEGPHIYLSYKRHNQLETGYYEYKNFRYSFSNYPGSLSNVFSASLTVTGSPALYYWHKTDDKIILGKNDLTDVTGNTKQIVKLKGRNRYLANGLSADILNSENDYYFGYAEADNSGYSVFSSGISAFVRDVKEFSSNMRIREKKQLYFGEIKFHGLKKISVYLPEEKAIKKIDFTNGGKSFITSKISDAENVDRFFIKNMNTKNYHLVYTNKNYGCISIKQLQ